MAHQSTATKTITQVERYGSNSPNGNPRYRVTFSDGTDALTKIDAAVNYGVSNADLRHRPLVCTFEGNLLVDVDGR